MPAKNYASTRYGWDGINELILVDLQVGQLTRDICPAAPGAKDWRPSSYSPRTGLVYIPQQNLSMDVEPSDVGQMQKMKSQKMQHV